MFAGFAGVPVRQIRQKASSEPIRMAKSAQILQKSKPISALNLTFWTNQNGETGPNPVKWDERDRLQPLATAHQPLAVQRTLPISGSTQASAILSTKRVYTLARYTLHTLR